MTLNMLLYLLLIFMGMAFGAGMENPEYRVCCYIATPIFLFFFWYLSTRDWHIERILREVLKTDIDHIPDNSDIP